jgi:hypothetical protein
LVDEHEDSLQGELAQGLVEERFEGRPHEIHDKDVEVTYIRWRGP